jgi:NAD(P)-dependent dehydrogenase (short-subunit alcohol dehydrogenase family)
MAGRLANRVAVVFGGASGIGAAAVARLQKEGARVVACDLHSSGSVQPGISEVICDVTDDEGVRATIAAIEGEHGRIDILVNSAGVVCSDEASSIDDRSWQRMLDVNLTGTMRTMRAVLPGMLERRAGAIVNIASVAAFNAGPEAASYAASKAAVVALSRSAAQRYGRMGVRVNALCPGWVATAMSQREMQELAAELEITVDQAEARTVQRIALGRMATSAEIAAACFFLASDDASFVTGAALVVDGGLRIPAAARAI